MTTTFNIKLIAKVIGLALLTCSLAGKLAAQGTGACILICPDNVTLNNDPGKCGATINYTQPTTQGDCTGLTVTCVPSPGFFQTGTTVVHCTAANAQGTSIAGCTFNVSVNDVEAPQISYPAAITRCADTGRNSVAIDYSVTANDNCGGVAVVCTPQSGSTFIVGVTTVQCTATPTSGQPISASFPVTVNNCSAVQITCPANITECTDAGKCTAVTTFAVSASSGATVVCTPNTGAAFPKGATTVACIATDTGGNTANCSFTVTVNDCEAPKIACPANLTQCKDAGKQTAVVNYAVTATDNCGTATVTCTPKAGTEFAAGTTTVSCVATDGSNNTSNCSFTVTVTDCAGPQITCPANLTKCTDSGKCTAMVTFDVSASASTTFGCTPKSGSDFAQGTTTVACVAIDAAGKMANCSFTVTVNDCEAPKIACPANITQCKDAGKQTAVVSFSPVATDNCGAATVVCTPKAGTEFAAGLTTVSCVATDSAGNTANCSFSVTVPDCAGPQITCPANLTQCTDAGKCTAVVAFNVSASGTAAVVCTPKSGAEFPKGTSTVACISTDASGKTANCSFTVTVNDCEAPKIACPANITQCKDAGKQTAVVSFSPVATDNCGAATVVCTPKAGTEFAAGLTTVSCVATDSAGNTANCSFSVTVTDCAGPQITCPANLTQCTDAGKCTAVVAFNVSATGTAAVVCTPKSGAEFPKGTSTVACIATDASGKPANCSFTVTVNDCAGPQLICPGDLTKCTDPGKLTAAVTFTPTATDNCGSVAVTCTPKSGSEFPKGTTPVTCTTADAAGKSASCTFAVHVVDCSAPSSICPGNMTTTTDPGKCSAIVSYNVNTIGFSSANCQPPTGSEFPKGMTMVTCTALDAAGHSTTCGFTVTVNDSNAPKISNVSASPDVLWPPNHQMIPVSLNVTSSDACQVEDCKIVSVTSSDAPAGHSRKGGPPDPWAITGDLTVELQSERSGNSAGRVYTITVFCVDGAGNSSTSVLTVPVAHDHSKLSHGQNGHNLTLTWDPTDTESVLESTDSLENPNWQPIPKGQQNQITVPTGPGRKFYRLRQ